MSNIRMVEARHVMLTPVTESQTNYPRVTITLNDSIDQSGKRQPKVHRPEKKAGQNSKHVEFQQCVP